MKKKVKATSQFRLHRSKMIMKRFKLSSDVIQRLRNGGVVELEVNKELNVLLKTRMVKSVSGLVEEVPQLPFASSMKYSKRSLESKPKSKVETVKPSKKTGGKPVETIKIKTGHKTEKITKKTVGVKTTTERPK